MSFSRTLSEGEEEVSLNGACLLEIPLDQSLIASFVFDLFILFFRIIINSQILKDSCRFLIIRCFHYQNLVVMLSEFNGVSVFPLHQAWFVGAF